jgi:ABC-type multidrug transport system ATPase subunit
MKQKLALSCALIHEPEFLLLDEPTTGVDAVSRKEFWEMLVRLKEHGITILVSTSYMDEASRCDRIALIQKGQILSINTPEGLILDYKKPLFEVKSRDMYRLIRDLRNYELVDTAFPFGDFVHMTTIQPLSTQEVLGYLEGLGHEKPVVNVASPTVEDCFMALMKT